MPNDAVKAATDAGKAAADAGQQVADAGKEGAVRLVNNLQDISFLQIALVVAGTWVAISLIRTVLPYLAERGPNRLRLYLLGAVPIVRLVLLTCAVLWIVPLVFNVTFQNFLVIAGAASVAVGFAFKDYVSSLIAGIVAVFEKPYRPGDWVEIDGDYGEVVSVGLRALSLRTPDANVVTVPHEKIWTENVSNSNDGARTLMCVAHFYVAPDHDAQALREALTDVAVTSAFLDYAKPVAVVLSETPWGTEYKVRAYPFDMRDQFRFVSDLTVRGKRAIRDVGAVPVCAPVAARA